MLRELIINCGLCSFTDDGGGGGREQSLRDDCTRCEVPDTRRALMYNYKKMRWGAMRPMVGGENVTGKDMVENREREREGKNLCEFSVILQKPV